MIYDKPAGGDWNRALPIGNGRFGAMIYGDVECEHYQLNEDSVWYGAFRDRNNKDAISKLPELRQLILEGKIEQAEELLKYAFSGTPQSQHPYQTLGDVYLDYCSQIQKPEEYRRWLSLSEAIHGVRIRDGKSGHVYRRETFASYHAKCIVSKFWVEDGSEMDLSASLQRLCFYRTTEHTKNELFISGNLGDGGMDYCCGMRFATDGGTVEALGEHLIAKGCRSITVYIAALTEFGCVYPRAEVKKILDQAVQKGYETIRKEHIEEYSSYFQRMSLSLAYDKELDQLTTEERRKRIDENHSDLGLISTYFDFGRYLLLSCSRGNCLPANLQGIWNSDMNPAWQSKYTININTEMNYWPADMCQLSECNEPLFSHMERMKVHGEKTAEVMYGCRGWVAHHNTDIWGDTAPQDIYLPATYWVMGAAWLCTHIMEHYAFTQSIDFLRRMYPLLKDSVEFFMDFLIEKDGEYLTCPSISPENAYRMDDGTIGHVTAGCTMDNEILMTLFSDYLQAAELVEERNMSFVEKAKEILTKLPPIQVGKYGQIMEWREDYEEIEPGHRHISHLWGLYPASLITMDGTPELAKAAKITLERRLAHGGGHTGWSRAWILNMYARLWDGDACQEHLSKLLQHSTLDNLFDNHPPFQIDGNFGATAAICEMLIQSNAGRVILLPALPSDWSEGEIKGVCARGGAKYDISWEHGLLKKVTIYASIRYETTVHYGTKVYHVSLKEGETLTL